MVNERPAGEMIDAKAEVSDFGMKPGIGMCLIQWWMQVEQGTEARKALRKSLLSVIT